MILQRWGPLQREISMVSGKVKWFNNAKGYGFVLADGKDEDLFAHYSAIQMDGYKTLKAGQPVSFDIIQGPKGLHAVNIRALPATTETPAVVNRPETAVKA
jgi:cold shock protein